MPILRRWRQRTLSLLGVEFSCEIKALGYTEERDELIANVNALLAVIEECKDKGEQEDGPLWAELRKPWLKSAFEHYVRNVDLETEDGEKIDTGAKLYAEADGNLLVSVAAILKMQVFSSGKDSPSPSISPSAPPAGESPAPPASSEDGTAPATAPEIPPAEPSSGAQG